MGTHLPWSITTSAAQCRRIRVTADGKLKGCLHSRKKSICRGLHGQALEGRHPPGDPPKAGASPPDRAPERHPPNMNQIGG